MITYKTFIRGRLNRSIMHFLEDWFRFKGISNPSLQDVINISEDVLWTCWLSQPAVIELIKFQELLKQPITRRESLGKNQSSLESLNIEL